MLTDLRVVLRMIRHRWLVYSGLTVALSLGCALTVVLFAVNVPPARPDKSVDSRVIEGIG